MIAEELKARISKMTPEERRELATFLAKLELEGDPDYWPTLQRRTDQTAHPDKWIPVEDI
ncbi:hypothetical protein [Roseibacillus ishigakijimensis]|uniref:Addiction module component n=1 Tax=Roseibacillus ishigakijimensis TaxID=454146 RepID=A0A934RTH2_9BACT|nr:hypothetical protein [Roseibacillus ishigakijimensis]MBK1835153.1 hypothetical protein [Roseibacillus ishigakijimensis]